MDTRSAGPWTDAGQDPELLRQAQRGDLAALLRIFNTHRRSLWRACVVIARHAGEAERLFQETIVRATRELPSAPVQQPLLPWLVKHARAIDAARPHRSAAHAATHRPDGAPWVAAGASAGGAHDVAGSDADHERRVLQGFMKLHADDQWLLALRIFERLTDEDIATVTGMPVEHVAPRLAVARDHIDQACTAEDRAA